MSQFPNVASPYGAPMGRSILNPSGPLPEKSVRLYRVRLDRGGYDDGGAYWGIGQPVYCAESTFPDSDYPGHEKEFRQFTRASDRHQAAERLKITPQQLIRR
jgi:hypothetical protein